MLSSASQLGASRSYRFDNLNLYTNTTGSRIYTGTPHLRTTQLYSWYCRCSLKVMCMHVLETAEKEN